MILDPDPLAGIPPTTVVVLSLVQVNVVPETPVNTIGVSVPAEQIVCDAGVAVAVVTGFTKTVAVIGVPEQPLAIGVMVKVTVTGAPVVLVNAPLIFPVPLAAIPVTVAVLFLVQL